MVNTAVIYGVLNNIDNLTLSFISEEGMEKICRPISSIKIITDCFFLYFLNSFVHNAGFLF